MSNKLAFNLLILALSSLQMACGDGNFTANQGVLEKNSLISSNEIIGAETESIDLITNEVKPTNQLTDATKPEETKPTTEHTQNEAKPANTCRSGLSETKACSSTIKPAEIAEQKPQLICRKSIFGKKICSPSVKPIETNEIKPQATCRIILGQKICKPIVKPTSSIAETIETQPTESMETSIPTAAIETITQTIESADTVITPPEAPKVCVDIDGDGTGILKGTTTKCSGNLQIDRRVASAATEAYNLNQQLSFNINSSSCHDTLATFTQPLGCFQQIISNSSLFNDYARSKGITKYGAITKFYKAGNTHRPLDRVVILVSPYQPAGHTTIDNELNWLFYKAKNDNAKLSKLLNYLHKNGISVLYVSFSHLANSPLPVVDKSRALAEVLIKFNKIRQANINNPEFEKTNIMGLSLGGIVAKKALTLLESRGIDHNVNMYMSMDSPHLGAHIPLGLQRLPEAVSHVFGYAKRKIGLRGVFDTIVDDILNFDFITRPLAQGASSLGQASSAAGSFVKDYFNDIPSNELIVYNTLAEEGLYMKEYTQMRRDTASLPVKTNKNIAIANGSITGRNLPGGTYFDLRTGKSNKVNFTLMVNPRGVADTYSYAWIKFPNRNTLYTSRRTYDYSFLDKTRQITEDRTPCGTTTDVIKGAEYGINEAVKLNWNERVKVYNYNTCFIPTASALMSNDGKPFKNSSFNANQSKFDEIIGTSYNSPHMFFSESITIQIISKFDIYRKQ